MHHFDLGRTSEERHLKGEAFASLTIFSSVPGPGDPD
jgi:hypothetical protein